MIYRNQILQNFIIFMIFLQAFFVVFFVLNEMGLLFDSVTFSDTLILTSIILKIIIDPITFWLSF